MRKFWKFLLKIVTFNGRFFTKKQALIEAQKVKTELTASKSTSIDVQALLTCLQGKNNINSVSATINLVVLNLKDTKVVDVQGLKKLGAKGIMASGLNLKIVFGDDSKVIAEQLQQLIT